MLGKLLKYDLKALSRILIPVHIAAIVVGLGAAACFFGAYTLDASYSVWNTSSGYGASMLVMLGLTGVFCLFALFMASAATLFTIVYRFYKNLFTDEGYLTLTLPVTANQQVASKVIAAMIWIVIDALIVGLGGYIASLAAMGFSGDFSDTIPSYLLSASFGFSRVSEFGSFLVASGNAFLQALTMVLTAYAAFALGSSLASKHKVAAGIGLFFALSWVAGLFHSIKSVLLATGFSYDSTLNYAGVNMLSSLVSLVIYLITAIVFYVICVYIIDRKTNLS